MKLLKCSVKNYQWGHIGKDSYITKFLDYPEINDTQPYSELWFGTHINGMALIKGENTTLKTYLKKSLRFLFKILSVKRALSIQVHPSKMTAEELHLQKPFIYKDSNHKPEMCVAITKFKLMIGFRKLDEIMCLMREYDEFRDVFGDLHDLNSLNNETDQLKWILKTFLYSDSSKIEPLINNLKSKLKLKNNINEIEKTILNLINFYPKDIGIFSPFLFNVLELNPGEAVFIPPNTAHCYLNGNCFECMACSDNVIRCALTKKYKDFELLIKTIDYKSVSKDFFKIKPKPENTNCKSFFGHLNGFGEVFCLQKINLNDFEDYVIEKSEYDSIVFVHNGSFLVEKDKNSFEKDIVLKMGDSFIIKSCEIIKIKSVDKTELIRCY